MLERNYERTSKKKKYAKIISTLFIINLALFGLYMIYTEEFTLPAIFAQKSDSLPMIASFKTKNDSAMKIQLGHSQYNTTNTTTQKYTSMIDFNWLENNPVYKQFRIKPLPVKKRVTVLVIVSSGPRRIDRRNAIRQTWWQLCKPTGKVTPECIFMTDYSPKGSQYYNLTHEESIKYGDVRFQNVPGGVTFGLRMLNHMVFAVSHYEFDYFLRVDDDYFMCFQNFLDEIPLPPLKRFHWGWVHRGDPRNIRPEESMLFLSHDLIETFLLQDPNKIMCHPWADQMIGEWSNAIDLKDVWHHDGRLWHHPPSRDNLGLQAERNVCHKYMALHGAYPKHMFIFWKHRGEFKKRKGDLKQYSQVVRLTQKYKWDTYGEPWRYEPKLCILNYKWDTSKQSVTGGSYTGRQNSRR